MAAVRGPAAALSPVAVGGTDAGGEGTHLSEAQGHRGGVRLTGSGLVLGRL